MTDTPVTIGPKPKMRLSASRLKTWMDCPLQAKFKYVDKLPSRQNAAATFGNCVHAALEQFCRDHDLDRALKMFEDYWTYPEKLGITPQTWPRGTSFGGYMERGKNSLRMYAESAKWINREFIASEHNFCVPFGEFELTGKVDLLEFSKDKNGDDTVKVTDFKSNARAPFVANLRLNVQFTVYDLASRQKEFWLGTPQFDAAGNKDADTFPPLSLPNTLFNTPEDAWERAQKCTRSPTWFGLMQAKEWDCGERNESDYMRLYRVAKEIEKALEHNVYVPNISGDTCGICPYVEPCKLPFDPRQDATNPPSWIN